MKTTISVTLIKKNILSLIALSCMPISALLAEQNSANMKLWYNKPARDKKWSSEALPLGNGKLGCMVFGGTAKEHIQFNEDTLWIGDEKTTGAYQNFGDMYIETGHKNISNYKRQLDISKAVQTITYTSNGVAFKREYFASYPAKVMVFRFSADKKNAYKNVKISIKDAHAKPSTTENSNTIVLKGDLSGFGFKKEKGYKIILDYEARAFISVEGGKLTSTQDGIITVANADAFTIYLAAGTDFINQRAKGWKSEHPHNRLLSNIKNAVSTPYNSLIKQHVDDYNTLFRRFSFFTGNTSENLLSMPTNERLDKYKQGSCDPELEAMLLQYGRYFIISASREGLPSNLQGIWNNSNNPPWRCDFHTDVNIEMNYWAVDMSNLSDCFQPLADWIMSIREVRKEETKKTFNTRGWLTHAENGPFGGSTWQWSKGDAAWMMQCLWSHYQYTLDKKYLKEYAYPLMKDICEFWVDHLKELPDGTLVSPDAYSPEHGPHEDGVSFDQQLVWNVFDDFKKASKELGIENELTKQISAKQGKLLGPKIGKWGQLQEWMVDRDNPKDQHRHLSHMIAVHPGHQISPTTTPKFAKAAEVSMNARGDSSTGWSKAWKINIWARLHDGNHAYKLINEFIKNNLYPNLFGFHPPFQMDCNFGYVSGVCEMLLQSHMGFIQFLPALPDAWKDGNVKGIKARGAFELDITWKEGKLLKADILSKKGGICKIYSEKPCNILLKGKKVSTTNEGGNIISFKSEAGKSYTLTPQ